jgi:hypothetical protein
VSYLHSRYMPCLSHPPWLDHSNYTWRRVKVMKLLIMQPYLTSYTSIFLLSKYSQHPVLKHPQSVCGFIIILWLFLIGRYLFERVFSEVNN